MKKLSFNIIVFFLILLSVTYGYGQQVSVNQIANLNADLSAKLDSSIGTLHLDTLHGKIPALFSKGSKIRAKTIQSLVEKCAEFYQPKFPETKFDLRIMILNQDDWDKTYLDEDGSPYGMPTAFSGINKLFIAADKKAVDKLFGVNENGVDNVLSKFDCVALHELGHIFLKRYNDTHTKKKWADEFLASYFALCFFQQHKSYPGLPGTGESGYQPKYKTLADFERLYSTVGAPNYAWYQGKFQELGERLYPKFKVELIKKFIANYSANGKKLDPLVLLQQLSPEITNQWIKEMK